MIPARPGQPAALMSKDVAGGSFAVATVVVEREVVVEKEVVREVEAMMMEDADCCSSYGDGDVRVRILPKCWTSLSNRLTASSCATPT